MKVMKVRLKEKSYNIVVGNNIVRFFVDYLRKVNIGRHAIIVTTPVINRLWGKKLLGLLQRGGFNVRVEEVADTEKSKSTSTCLALLNRIANYGKSKKVFIIAFGGGVVGDLAGFAAAIYKRGVPYIQLPTTLISQVDSSIGGKVAIDLKVGKNLIGAFYQPRLVFSETTFLKTLPDKEIKNGFSEIIKYGIIKDKKFFKFLEDNVEKVLMLDKKVIQFVLERASQIKANVVQKDEFDKLSVRAILNYGHTIGHAIETASGYSKRYTHGMAISIGMIAANFISQRMGIISKSECSRIEDLLKRAGLPVRAKGIAPSKVYEAHLYDKKFTHGTNRFVLPVSIGRVKIVEGVSEALIKGAIQSVCRGGE
ncbi:MAG: 3-dehydroquinate synthase [Candidatus Omnitrophica bacterium]|nr:3-dehydroquinate synthase [Candidatus Omnitrophota bacterium]